MTEIYIAENNFNRGLGISYDLKGVSIYNEEDWDKMIKFIVENIEKFIDVFSKEIENIRGIVK